MNNSIELQKTKKLKKPSFASKSEYETFLDWLWLDESGRRSKYGAVNYLELEGIIGYSRVTLWTWAKHWYTKERLRELQDMQVLRDKKELYDRTKDLAAKSPAGNRLYKEYYEGWTGGAGHGTVNVTFNLGGSTIDMLKKKIERAEVIDDE